MKRDGAKIGLVGENGVLQNCEDVNDVQHRVLDLIRLSHSVLDYPVLKLSGGELSAVPEWLTLVFDAAKSIPIVQLLSNGSCLTEDVIRQIIQAGNVSVQVSLDGVTKESNVHRHLKSSDIRKILEAIEQLVQAEVRVEINAVITRSSLSNFYEFIAWGETIARENSHLMIFPRPARGPAAHMFLPDPVDVPINWRTWAPPSYILPPSPYMERVHALLLRENRQHPCYVPFFVLGSDDKGCVPVCTCMPKLGSVGDLCDVVRDPNHRSSFKPNQAPKLCRDCFSQYDYFNLLVEGELEIEEARQSPLLSYDLVTKQVRKTLGSIQSDAHLRWSLR